MKNITELKEFFEQYGVVSCSDDVQPLAGFYADSFIVAGPEGSAAFHNDEHFARWLDQLREGNERSGLKGMQIVAFNEFPISDQYKGATITWGAQFEKTGEELIQFNITYFVHLLDEVPKIIMYISERGQEALMQEKGLL
ncbi:hypothetical protein [Taibaiella koreensis]|uniref:hypothetical protein n=1 Tax=Taibaiella koreensis TaxID=1268548 RepID=UPI000E59FCD7|nr:hypothetical protein [Taibaiella koreensis]